MHQIRRLLLCVFFALMARDVAAAQSPPSAEFAKIVDDLGSLDFPVREAAQARLGKMPADQIDLLRAAAEKSKDPEVKTRLEARIDQMEIDLALHPKPLSVNFDKTPMSAVMETLNKQIGMRSFVWNDQQDPKVTLKATNQPVWEILRQVNLQVPFDFRIRENVFTLKTTNKPWQITQVDGVGILYTSAATPGDEVLNVATVIYLDPRVRLIRLVTDLEDVKAVDQAGNVLKAGVLASAGVLTDPIPWSGGMALIQLKKPPGPIVLKDFTATVRAEILMKEDVVDVDLRKLPIAPIDTKEGRIAIEADGYGGFDLKMLSKTNNYASLTLSVFDEKDAEIEWTRWRYDFQKQISLKTNGGELHPASLELVLPVRSQEVRFPFTLHDVPLMPIPARVPPVEE